MSTDPWKDPSVYTARPGIQFAEPPDPLRSVFADNLRSRAAARGWVAVPTNRHPALTWQLPDVPVDVTVLLPDHLRPTRITVTLTDPTDEPLTDLLATVGYHGGAQVTAFFKTVDRLTQFLTTPDHTQRSTR